VLPFCFFLYYTGLFSLSSPQSSHFSPEIYIDQKKMFQTFFQRCAEIGNPFAFDGEVTYQPPSQPAAYPTSVQAACLQHIQMSATTKFDDACPEHMALLHRLWRAWYSISDQNQQPTTPPPIEIPSKLWKKIGFQRTNPISDIRGGAELCVRNMVYFAETYPHTLMQLRKNKARRYEEMKHEIPTYPITAVAINITRLLTEIFNIVEPLSGSPKWFCQEKLPYYRFLSVESSAYVNFVGETAIEVDTDYFKMGEKAINEMFCFVFQYLDYKWDIQNASYMDFNVILKEVKEDIVQLLSLAPPHASLWWIRLHIGLFTHAKDFTPFSEQNLKVKMLAPALQMCDRSCPTIATSKSSGPSNCGDLLHIGSGSCKNESIIFATTVL
jgi:hypothetical protein